MLSSTSTATAFHRRASLSKSLCDLVFDDCNSFEFTNDNDNDNEHYKQQDANLNFDVNEGSDSYGFFTELEPEESADATSATPIHHFNAVQQLQGHSATTASSFANNVANLTFVAPVAPQSVQVSVEQEAELKYAQAADTVDDVLADFF